MEVFVHLPEKQFFNEFFAQRKRHVSEKFFLGVLFGLPESVRGIDDRLTEIENDGFNHAGFPFKRKPENRQRRNRPSLALRFSSCQLPIGIPPED